MLCIANEPNQKRINGKIRTFATGETFDFEECPEYFTAIDNPPENQEGEIDFATMGEKWLRQYDGDPDDLEMFLRETYKDVVIPANPTWNELVSILQVQRETNILVVDNTGKLENKLSSVEQTADTITVTVEVPEVKAPVANAPKAPEPPASKEKTTSKKVEEPKPEVAPDLSKSVEDDLDDLFKE